MKHTQELGVEIFIPKVFIVENHRISLNFQGTVMYNMSIELSMCVEKVKLVEMAVGYR